MGEKFTPLEERIAHFEALLEQMKEVTREANSSLGEMKRERREIERLLSSKELTKMVDDKVNEFLGPRLEQIGKDLGVKSRMIYDKVGKEIDKLINLSLGKEYAVGRGKEDVRPALAAKLKEWLKEEIDKED